MGPDPEMIEVQVMGGSTLRYLVTSDGDVVADPDNRSLPPYPGETGSAPEG